MVKNETLKHTETILCPECGSLENATVEQSIPWWIYIHECKNCDFIIMESDFTGLIACPRWAIVG